MLVGQLRDYLVRAHCNTNLVHLHSRGSHQFILHRCAWERRARFWRFTSRFVFTDMEWVLSHNAILLIAARPRPPADLTGALSLTSVLYERMLRGPAVPTSTAVAGLPHALA